ncbi:MAG UNVERIFIED_CONTAM: hypothetical protein LVT10_16480 [Anaerolineae bacterium]
MYGFLGCFHRIPLYNVLLADFPPPLNPLPHGALLVARGDFLRRTATHILACSSTTHYPQLCVAIVGTFSADGGTSFTPSPTSEAQWG